MMNEYKTVLGANRRVQLMAREITEYGPTREPANDAGSIFELSKKVLELDKQTEEYLYCLCFDTKMHLLGFFEASHGAVNGTIVDTRSIFQKALLIGATCIILVHNHPSGDPTPSRLDEQATIRTSKAGQLIGIELVDHIIIGNESFCSMREQGRHLFEKGD